MNLTSTLAVATLIIINSVVGLLLMLGKVRLVVVRPEQAKPPETPDIPEVVLPDLSKRKRGRPRKADTKRKTRHLYLPAHTTKQQLAAASDFFRTHQGAAGDNVVLHLPTKDGPERDIEIPYPVRWSEQVKDNLSTILDGWS